MNVIIDYNAGNIRSLANALEKLDIPFEISNQAEVIRNADRVLFPGQGNIAQAKEQIDKLALSELIRSLEQPFLGICVGMQLLYKQSEEGEIEGLGILSGEVKRFPNIPGFKIPQMGWNTVAQLKESPLFRNIPDEEYFYFVHSYYCPTNEFEIGETPFSVPFTSVVQKDNFFGAQFHPEKSGKAGLQFLSNFIKL